MFIKQNEILSNESYYIKKGRKERKNGHTLIFGKYFICIKKPRGICKAREYCKCRQRFTLNTLQKVPAQLGKRIVVNPRNPRFCDNNMHFSEKSCLWIEKQSIIIGRSLYTHYLVMGINTKWND